MAAYFKTPPPAAEAIIQDVLERWSSVVPHLTRERLVGADTADRRLLATARYECWWRIRQLYARNRKRYPMTVIGRWFHDRDHSTIVSGVQRWEELLVENGGVPPPPPEPPISYAEAREWLTAYARNSNGQLSRYVTVVLAGPPA